MSVIGITGGVGFESIGERVVYEIRSHGGSGVTRLGALVVRLGARIEAPGCYVTDREVQAHRDGYKLAMDLVRYKLGLEAVKV